MTTVLHIDNSSLFTGIVKNILKEKGVECISTSELDTALDILDKTDVDMVITGLELEDGSGDEIIKTLYSKLSDNTPIIVSSSHNSLELRQRMFSLGILDYIPKNESIENISLSLERLLKNKESYEGICDMSIAVLDDSPLILSVVKKIFDFHSINDVDYFKLANDLLISKKEYNIYIIDVFLIDTRGEVVMSEIRNKHKNSLIIAISGINDYKAISNILVSGADDYIIKPFDSNIFMARIMANVKSYLLLKELEKKNQALKLASITDGLTQLFNHIHIYEKLETAVKECIFSKKRFSILMLDIDNFKSLNDTYGHQFGDAVLVKVASEIERTSQGKGIAGRYGGEEFLVMLPMTPLDDGYALAEDIRRNIEQLDFAKDDLKVTVSGGIAEYNGETALALVARADQLLYLAKASGRNRIERK